jgi:hypothetical protein
MNNITTIHFVQATMKQVYIEISTHLDLETIEISVQVIDPIILYLMCIFKYRNVLNILQAVRNLN